MNFKTYYQLTKPGIIYGNALTTIGGFLFGARGAVDPLLLLATLLGISLVIASGCVYNNYIDRGIDAHMERTRKRALVSGDLSARNALIFGTILGLFGAVILYVSTNFLTFSLAIFGWIMYVIVYGYFKRKTVHGTVVGSISGAIPIVVGYCAATGVFDSGALILFLIMTTWEMPHFYAIAMYRRDEYASAAIPVLSVVGGLHTSKKYIAAYTALFIIAALLLTVFAGASYSYGVVMALIGGWWLYLGVRSLSVRRDRSSTKTEAVCQDKLDMQWARTMFRFSLITLLAFSLLISVDHFLP